MYVICIYIHMERELLCLSIVYDYYSLSYVCEKRINIYAGPLGSNNIQIKQFFVTLLHAVSQGGIIR